MGRCKDNRGRRLLAAVLALVLAVANVPLTVWAEDCADGHHYEAEVFAPTCTEDGFTVYTCSECGDTYVDDEIATLGHQSQDGFCAVCGIFMTVEGVYEIYNAEQLYLFAELVNSGETNISGRLMADITVNTGVLTEDGKLNGDGSNFRVWTPIAWDNWFSGSFDGNGKKIAGLYFNDSSQDYVGLFGYASGIICNLEIIDFYFCGGDYVGGVVGYGAGTVSNCSNTGSVIGNGCVGGVVGCNWGYSSEYSSGTISNCSNTGSITGHGSVGGIAGSCSGIVVACDNMGSITGTDTVGGIVGEQYRGVLSGCYNAGAVSGRDCIGGIVGNQYNCKGDYPEIADSRNEGRVTGNSHVGGVVGSQKYFGSDDEVFSGGLLRRCYNLGTVVAQGDYAGGIAGYGDAYDCYNMGEVTGGNCVGGIAGHLYGTIKTCYNIGNVSGTERVGGVAGYAASGNAVSGSYNTGNVSGTERVGGVVGYAANGKTVSGCYSIGSVTGSSYYIGGVVGKNEGTVSGCYYIYGNVKDGNGTRQFGIGCETLGSYVRDVSGSTAMKSKAAFASGEVCYLLQEGLTKAVWGQEIGVDASPVLGGATVYPASDCKGDAAGYSNIEGDTVHDYENAICVDCGECYRSGDIKWQLSSGASVEDASTNLRLISYVDTLADYSKVVFTVSFMDASGVVRSADLNCTTAYTELIANGASIGTADGIFGEGANYFVTYTIEGWPQAYFDTEIAVTLTRYDLKGEVASVAARTFAVADGM